MDFVVVGFGIGALGLLLGLILRDGGSWWSRVRGDRLLAPADVVRRVARGRACRAGGRVLAIAGAGACVATLLALLARLNDRRGAEVVLAFLIAGTLGALAWGIAYTRRYHARPVRLRPRQRRPAPSLAGAAVTEPVALAAASLLDAPDPSIPATSSPDDTDASPDESDPSPAHPAVDSRGEQPAAGLVAMNGALPLAEAESPAPEDDGESSTAPSVLTGTREQRVEETTETPGERAEQDGQDGMEAAPERMRGLSPAGKLT